MSKQVTTSEPKLSLGLDIHKKTWKFHFTTDLFIGSGHSFPPNPEVILNYVRKPYVNYQVSVAYEAGCCGYEPARAFKSYGWDTYVFNPGDLPRSGKQKFVKTDKIDAKNIALQLRSGHIRKLSIPSKEQEGLRCLTRQRTALVRNYRRIKSRIKSFLLYHQLEVPSDLDGPKWSKAFINWLRELDLSLFTNRLTLESMLREYEFIDKELKELSNKIRAYCRKHYNQDYNLLRSVPGIAGLTAGYILSELGDLRRFSSLKKFASYVGFVPGMQQSGGNYQTQGASPRANRHIRNQIIEAAWIAVRTDPVMEQYYRSHGGKNSKAVIFKVGRKLLSKILAVIKTETPYQVGITEKPLCTKTA